MQSNLKSLFQIQTLLQDLGYPDYKRISPEVIDFINDKKLNQNSLIERLKSGEPWEYIKGYTDFCDNNFKVTSGTLIPRIETEQLVYEAIKILKSDSKVKDFLDIGTGTGCIPISVAKQINSYLNIVATDISNEALKVAKENEKNILGKEYIKWVRTDLTESIQLSSPTLITANLPYIPKNQYEKLDDSVKLFEPRIALLGGEKGYEIYEKFFKNLDTKKINVKYIVLETETSIISQTKELAERYFRKAKIQVLKDSFERERFLLISFL
ncbi:hypothetical protein CVU76_03280 [Candidatus Dojkabacteria bacterium HGW-Dojkabacteria-1]|uniref:peptide chain release factor N(5)-glutamine methyltransferase n=1 Tax=Candidatus Dojkabacteria bacterium HGW-Dojkabacteria-1 TaxID=2013761 RepID=A0A2N2F483_9BACT|nr:MAG: hypothetical protein CVU76_03280 [Candidatus Dojkabacteria bacterium HGW-Dojkabacteria-1]